MTLSATLQRIMSWTTLRFRRAGPTIPLDRLIEGARIGVPQCLGELYRRYHPRVLAFLATLAPAEAEDLAQEVFVALPAKLGSYREQGSFEPWLKRVAFNIYRTRRRSADRRREDPLDEALAGPMPAMGRVTLEDFRDHAIAGLPPSLREVWVLHREGYEARDIASLLGITPGAAATRLTRARDYLRVRLPNLL